MRDYLNVIDLKIRGQKVNIRKADKIGTSILTFGTHIRLKPINKGFYSIICSYHL